MLYYSLDPAERGCQGTQPHVVNKRSSCIDAVPRSNEIMPPKPLICSCGHVVILVRDKPRIIYGLARRIDPLTYLPMRMRCYYGAPFSGPGS